MDTSLVDSKTLELLSRITGQRLHRQDLTPPVIFLVALISVLVGVMLVDGKLKDEEKRSLKDILKDLIRADSRVRQLAEVAIRGVRQQQIYKKSDEIITLFAPLSESERLLSVGYACEISVADGEMNAKEKTYIERIAKKIHVEPKHLEVLKARFSHQDDIDTTALDEVKFLLDPVRFRSLGVSFVNAADRRLASLPTQTQHRSRTGKSWGDYQSLQTFQTDRKQLDNLCYQLFQILQDGSDRGFFSQASVAEICDISRGLQSHRFRIAVLGEFCQGKSTLLNALLGEEIQPARAIPCSAAVTVVKHGSRERVMCRYKDKREEEIPFDEYPIKATISERAALSNPEDELTESEIEEIIVEHPELPLCGSGVEIVDSPGLNGHPKPTAIIQKAIENTDAVIFIANACHPLTRGERELIREIKTLLNGGEKEGPADNLFVAVNFMDLLRCDRKQIQQLFQNFFREENDIIETENRLYFISARTALEAIFSGHEGEYFRDFTQFKISLETFLIQERGEVEIDRKIARLKKLLDANLETLEKAEKNLDRDLHLSQTKQQKILEAIDEAKDRNEKIRHFAEQVFGESIEGVLESFNQWVKFLGYRIADKSESWHSEHSPFWEQKKLIKDYTDRFVRDLSGDLRAWKQNDLMEILQKNIDRLDSQIEREIRAIRHESSIVERQTDISLSWRLDLKIKRIDDNIAGAGGFIGGGMAGLGVAGALFVLTDVALVGIAIAGIVVAIAGSLGLGMLDVDDLHGVVKRKVYDSGLEKFYESAESIFENIDEKIEAIFDERVRRAGTAIAKVISRHEESLELEKIAGQNISKEVETKKVSIAEKREEIRRVQQEIGAFRDRPRPADRPVPPPPSPIAIGSDTPPERHLSEF